MNKSRLLSRVAIASLLLLSATVAGSAASFVTEEWTLPAEPGHLAGTLLLPAGEGPWPVTLILAGSGPTDRDGNSTQFPGGNNSLKQLAEVLVAEGVASLRVDKRNVGGSVSASKSEFDLRFKDYIDDAVAWCARLQADPRFSSLTVVGHSQGAQVGMNAAWLSNADGFVSISGPGQGLLDLLREQLGESLPVRTRVKAEQVMHELEMERLVPEPPVELTILFRPSVQEFLISWNRHDPLVEIARLPLPVLVVQGTTDIQVPVADAEKLVAARPGAQLLIVEGMNHVMKMVVGDNNFAQQSSLVDSTLMIAPAVPAAVVALVREADDAAEARRAARDLVQERARRGERLMTPAAEDSVLAAEFADAPGEKVGRWARRFVAADKVTYLFGPKPGGYVAEGDVVADRNQDCVSLLYRVGELARARNAEDAVDWALRTRFAGTGVDGVADTAGRLDYDDPAHLDFSLDMIRTGMWGRDVSRQLAGTVTDTVGSSRYPARSFGYVPTAALSDAELREGDVVWFVLNPAHETGAKLRQEYGLVIGHIGIVVQEEGQPWLIHAASSDLEGWYDGGTVVKVPLADYLQRVEKFAGVVVTRF
ncbi:MAG: alpha/beta fold hydrolase [Candidatus Krumholzibacteria bacterium]|nr:alpha/beta fold hydrolase [Candidatus Krumholzibacteria bacterium]